ncbi:MAG: glycoside hydrolase family 130 protein [Chloroflexota bacterium]|nr:glycoside hydrolase family 130 protein [Chloroflexota bacterium]MDE3101116.1 glycoside hydrolase family 130 protein [Chloroflexota bacterium]
MRLATRVGDGPLLRSADVAPSLPELEVVSVFNPAAARVGDETVLLLRVGERPRSDVGPPPGAVMLELGGPRLSTRPLPPELRADDVVGMTFLDVAARPPRVAVAYVRRDTPGLDLSDPRTIRFRSGAAFNGTEDYLSQMSHLRVARSGDGIHFSVERTPALTPSHALEEYGIEDPRVTCIDGEWHVTYVSVSRLGITTSLATTRDFVTFERRGVVMHPDQKDVVLFPERVGGRYVALTRPMPQSFARVFGIWIAFSADLVSWGGHRPLALPRLDGWDAIRTGAGSVPFRTRRGWLELYHGVDRDSRYAIGAILLDGEDPRRVIGRSPEPILLPEEPYEREGMNADTIFVCGHVPLDATGSRVRVYYGAADCVVAAADLDVAQVLAHLEPVGDADQLAIG